MRTVKIVVCMVFFLVIYVSSGLAESGVELEGVEVKAKEEKGFVEKKKGEPGTESTVTKEGIDILGTPAQTNVYKALDPMPSMHVESADPYGFLVRSPFNIKSRGESGIGMGYTVEGVPVWGIESPGPRADMFDLENFRGVTFYRGAVPPDQGFGSDDTAGSIDARILKPSERFGLTLNESAGSFDFHRTYLRVDTGAFQSDIKLYISGSTSSADKWRGPGTAPGYRDQTSLGVTKEFSHSLTVELFTDYLNSKSDNYRALTFAQAADLKDFRRFDYNTSITGTASKDVNYYNFNWEKDKDLNVFAVIKYDPDANSSVIFKPYYWTENRPHNSGSSSLLGKPGIDARVNEFDRYGGILEYKTLAYDTAVKLGYWVEVYSFPISEKVYRVTPDGNLSFDSWLLSKDDGNGLINSPYFKADRTFGKLHAEAGLRYINLSDPAKIGYMTTGLPDVSYDDVFNFSPVQDPGASYKKSTKEAWLPNIGVDYEFSKDVNAYFNYGRNYAKPRGYPELMKNFISSRSVFTSAGLTIQELVDKIKLETSDNYDLGMRYTNGSFFIAPTLFYVKYDNKLLSVLDPNLNIQINQSVGNAEAYGAELEMGVNPTDNLVTFTSLSYNKARLTNDIRTASNAILSVNGKTTPDTSKFIGKLGATYTINNFAVSPVLKYVGSRYGNVTNTEQVRPYTVVDLNVDYRRAGFLGLREFDAGFSILNLFDKKYIGLISAFDDSQAGSYYPGAPFTAAFTVSAKY